MRPSLSERASQALARIGERGGKTPTPPTRRRGGASRSHVLLALLGHEGEATLEDLSEITGLHVNTVRGHLDVLVAGGYVERDREEPQGRGRPRLTYRASEASDSPYDELAHALSDALESADARELATATATKWRRTTSPIAPAQSPDEAVDSAVEGLRGVGFAAESSALGDSIVIGSCPYASLIADHPIICDIHTELLAQILTDTGQDVTVAGMDVWVKPTLCRARLERPDLTPMRSIELGEPSTSSNERLSS
jgi:predicted ArsR family transcriptional regulator